jgi:hypothetical protein
MADVGSEMSDLRLQMGDWDVATAAGTKKAAAMITAALPYVNSGFRISARPGCRRS